MLSNIQSGIAKLIRSSGQTLDRVGRQFEVNPYVEKLHPSTKLVKLGKEVPHVNRAFVATSATVVGKVKIGAGASIWHGAVLRGDDNSITVLENATVGDRAMLHSSNHPRDLPTVVGRGAVVEAGAILHGCVVEDGAYIGHGAQVLDGATVGKGAVVAAGAVVSMGKTVPAGMHWAGVPAKELRAVSAAEAARVTALAAENKLLSEQHALEEAKSWQTIEDEAYDHEQKVGRSDYYYRRLSPEDISRRLGEVENHEHPGRVLDSRIASHTMPESRP